MKCKFKKSNGKVCGANAMHGTEFCWFHTPNISDENKKLASSKGGKANSDIPDPKLPEITISNPQDIPALLIDAILNVREDRMELRKGSVIAYLSSTLLKAYEVSDISTRIENIEKDLISLNPLNRL
jgi:hypothetical protein